MPSTVDAVTLLALRMVLALPFYVVIGWLAVATGGGAAARCRR